MSYNYCMSVFIWKLRYYPEKLFTILNSSVLQQWKIRTHRSARIRLHKNSDSNSHILKTLFKRWKEFVGEWWFGTKCSIWKSMAVDQRSLYWFQNACHSNTVGFVLISQNIQDQLEYDFKNWCHAEIRCSEAKTNNVKQISKTYRNQSAIKICFLQSSISICRDIYE